MLHYAGLDWSGTPFWRETGTDPKHYIPCGVRVDDAAAVESTFSAWRTELHRPAEYEFHGYKSDPPLILRFVDYALEHATVAALIFDKRALSADLGARVFDKPALLPVATGQIIVHQMLEAGPIRKLWCDKGDIASNRRGDFNTQLMRKARVLWPDGLSIVHVPSQKSPMIQLADMVAYALHREAQGLWQIEEISRKVKRLWKKDGNFIRWGNSDDLRPYLLP